MTGNETIGKQMIGVVSRIIIYRSGIATLTALHYNTYEHAVISFQIYHEQQNTYADT
jgi:hypothetical protein